LHLEVSGGAPSCMLMLRQRHLVTAESMTGERRGSAEDRLAMEHHITEAPSGIWDRANRALTIGLILTVAGAAFEALAVATILPATVEDLGGLSLYGWAFSAFMLTNLVGVTIAGGEADRSGPARPFLVGIVLFSLGLIVAGVASSMEVVIVGRAIQGFGAGAIGAIAYVAVGRGYHEAVRPRMLALISSAWVVPGLIGPAIAGFIAGAGYFWDWRR
jgi:MFS family permease